MRINQRNVFNVITESLASGSRILAGSAATSLKTDSITEPFDTGVSTLDFQKIDSPPIYTT